MECREGMDEETMIKPIVKDIFFLGQKSEAATKQDLPIGQDLQDTLNANRDRCVGLAANMIGVPKSIIAVLPPGMQQPLVMLNPQPHSVNPSFFINSMQAVFSMITRVTIFACCLPVTFPSAHLCTKALKASNA